MPNSQIGLPQLVYFCFMKKYIRPEKRNKRGTRVASLVRNSPPQNSEMPGFSYAAKLGSHSWSTATKYKRELSLKEHKHLITMKGLHLTRGWGDMTIKLHPQICRYRAMSACMSNNRLLHLCMKSAVNTSADITNISAATLLQTAFCHGLHTTTGCHLQGLLFLFRSL